MDGKLYIKKIIRSDGETLAFDANEIYLATDNTLLVRPEPTTTAVSYTEADGGEMIRQQAGIYNQTVNGLMVPKTHDYWTLTQTLGQFFQFDYTYKIIYIQKSGAMFSVSNAWISSGLQITPVPDEAYSQFTLTFAIGDVNWRQYTENSQGVETYSNTVTLPLATSANGGEQWDSVGEQWDSVGTIWEVGTGGPQTVAISSTKNVYPVWTVAGPCTNPTLTNNTTNTTATYTGSIATGQTLVVNFAESVAHLDTALVTRNVTGLVSLKPGGNVCSFNRTAGTTESSTIAWNNIIA